MEKAKAAKHTGLLIVILIALCGAIFAFTRPMLAPGFNTGQLTAPDDTLQSVESASTFIADDFNQDIGENIRAKSFLVYEENTGQLIASKNPKTVVAIASITKLMTAYVVQKHGNLNDLWAINAASTHDIRPILSLEIGDRVVIKDLVNSILIGSANDAAAALGQYITSVTNKPIIELMNEEAKLLGMKSTHYENPIGFDSEQNYSTAEDLKLLLDEIRPIPLFSSIDRAQSYSFISENGNSYSVRATNTLVASDPEIHAIKTGFTNEAGGAMITSISHENQKFIIIVIGSPNREADTKLLKEQVIRQTAE